MNNIQVLITVLNEHHAKEDFIRNCYNYENGELFIKKRYSRDSVFSFLWGLSPEGGEFWWNTSTIFRARLKYRDNLRDKAWDGNHLELW